MTDPEGQATQIRLDLAELDTQISLGEIDEDTGTRLRATYLAELDALDDATPVATRSKPRLLVGALILVVGFAITIAVLGSTVGTQKNGALQGVAAGDEFDPAEYSDETMEAVIAANADDPEVATQLPYMRFALAERYFERGEFQRSFVHYEAILTADPPSDLFARTMTRVAWITFVGNGEIELALQVIDRAIETAPESTEALYVKGQILWCGAGDPAAAAVLFERVLSSDQLDTEIREQVETDLSFAADGEPCA